MSFSLRRIARGLFAQPFAHVVGVGLGEELEDSGVALSRLGEPVADGEQMDVVVAEYDGGGGFIFHHPADGFGGLWSAIDEVADLDDGVGVGLKLDCGEQPPKSGEASVQVADGVGCHGSGGGRGRRGWVGVVRGFGGGAGFRFFGWSFPHGRGRRRRGR